MKVTELLYFPYSQAQSHFKQAAQSEWKGWTIHTIVGALEYIPILNYLIALVDLVVQSFFKAKFFEFETKDNSSVRSNSDNSTADLKLDEFLKTHSISLSPRLEALQKIVNDHSTWTEDKQDTKAWERRPRPIKLLQEDLKKLEITIEGNPYEDPYQVFQNIKEEHAKLKAAEEKPLQNLSESFQCITEPRATSIENYLGSLDCKAELLSERGIKTLDDVDVLQLRAFDHDVCTLERFKLVLEFTKDDTSYKSFLNSLKVRLEKEMAQDVMVKSEKTLEKWQSLAWDKSCDEFIKGFQAFVLVRKQELLNAYLDQDCCHGVWQMARNSAPNMGLAEFCRLHEIATPSGCYMLSVVLEKKN